MPKILTKPYPKKKENEKSGLSSQINPLVVLFRCYFNNHTTYFACPIRSDAAFLLALQCRSCSIVLFSRPTLPNGNKKISQQ